jgi:predicted DNA-binding transcriptional regulator AlpA
MSRRRRSIELLSRRDVLRQTGLAEATLSALLKASAFPAPVLAERWEPAAVAAWLRDARSYPEGQSA